MKFNIVKAPSKDDKEFKPISSKIMTIAHLESIVKAQGELLQQYRDATSYDEIIFIDIDAAAPQQAIKESQT